MNMAKQNERVLAIEKKLGDICQTVQKMLARIDPHATLVFSQAHEIERLRARNLALGFILDRVEQAREVALREFERLQAQGMDVNAEVIEAMRACLAERDDRDNGGDDNG